MVRIGMIALGVSFGVLLTPSQGQACTYEPGVVERVPSGTTHPANSAVVLLGAMLRPDALVATIDGVPVEITVDDSLAVLHGSGVFHVLPLRLEPAPEPGQEVAITGNPCGPTGCGELGIEYVASEPDLEILGAAPTLSFDVARVLEDDGSSCGSTGSRLRVSATVDALAYAGEALVMFEVTASNEDAGLTVTERRVFSRAELEAWVMIGPLGKDFPMNGWCVELGTIDAAGNRGAVASSCEACGRSYGEPTDGGDIEFEPVPGGPCDVAGSTSTGASSSGEPPEAETGGDASTVADDSGGASGESGAASGSDGATSGAPGADGVTDRGCGCGAGGGDAVGGPAIFGLALGRRRRRR